MRQFYIGCAVPALVALILLEWSPWPSQLQVGESQGSQGSSASVTVQLARPIESQAAAKVPVAAVPKALQTANVSVTQQTLNTDAKAVVRAQLSPLNFTTISSELNAKIDALPLREGEWFEAGDLLVSFDCAVQQTQLQKFEAIMAIAQRNAQSNQRLYVLGAVSRLEADNSASEFLRAQADANEIKAILTKCKIVAPFNGRVVEQKMRSQQFAQTGQAVLDILDRSALELEFVAPSKWAAWITVGLSFQIRVDETNRSYPAHITRVAAKIDSISQTLKLAAVIDRAYPELSPGMSGTIEIEAAKELALKAIE